MNLQKLIVSSAAALCAFAVCNVHAGLTNTVTFSATTFSQGATNTVNGTNNSFAAAAAKGHNTAQILQELGNATSHTFTKAAKLVLISGNDVPQFAVIDGANFVDVSSIMTLNVPDQNRVQSGTQNGNTGLSFPTLKELQIIELDYDDTGILGDSGLQFSLQGLATITTTDTTPSAAGLYTETIKAKVASMTGSGWSGSPFVATGSLSISGKGTLSLSQPQ